MTVLDRPAQTHSHFAMWAWVCDALTPVIIAAIAILGLLQHDEAASASVWSRVILIAVSVAAPIAGIILGIEAHRKAERTGAAAAVVAALLVVAAPAALFLLVI